MCVCVRIHIHNTCVRTRTYRYNFVSADTMIIIWFNKIIFMSSQWSHNNSLLILS